jgi:hypothetical protein
VKYSSHVCATGRPSKSQTPRGFEELSIVQKPSAAEEPSMPEYAILHDHVSAALTVDEIGDALVLLAEGSRVPVDGIPPVPWTV